LALSEDVLGLPTEARAELPITGTQLGEYDRGDGRCSAAKFYDELDGKQPWR